MPVVPVSGVPKRFDPSEDRLAALIDALESAHHWDRGFAAKRIAEAGPEAKPAIPALIQVLQSQKPLRRPYTGGIFTDWDRTPGEARKALVRIGPAAVPALTEALKNPDALTRVNAAWALWQLEKRTDAVLPVLVQAWKDREEFTRDECVRYDASGALNEIGREAPDKVLPILVSAAKGEDEDLACSAYQSLAVVGPSDARAVAALAEGLEDRRERVGDSAGWALRNLGQSAVPLLVTALEHKDSKVRGRAARELCAMEEEHLRSALPALERAEKDSDPEVRKFASLALEKLRGEKR